MKYGFSAIYYLLYSVSILIYRATELFHIDNYYTSKYNDTLLNVLEASNSISKDEHAV
jgi:hypothetical protein